MSKKAAADLRERRRAAGMKETTVWLDGAAERALAALVERKGFHNRSEAIQYALSTVATKEQLIDVT